MKNQLDNCKIDYIKIYQEKGFTSNFCYENSKLINVETKKKYSLLDISVVAEHKFETLSPADDKRILYIIETKNGDKGMFSMGMWPNADLELSVFFHIVLQENRGTNKNNHND